MTISQLRAVVLTIYRPGSQPVTAQFFDNLASVLERLVILNVALFVTGDFNIHIDRDTDHHAKQKRSVIDAFGVCVNASGPTHRLGGTLDAVASRAAVPALSVDVDFSDHHLLHWRVSCDPPVLQPIEIRTCPWRRLDECQFRCMFSASALCLPSSWPLDVDAAASLYADVISSIIYDIFPAPCVVRHRPLPTDPWLDADCRAAKRQTRRLERLSSARHSSASAAMARETWLTQRRAYRQLRHQKCRSFWTGKFTAATNLRDRLSLIDRCRRARALLR